MFLLVGLSLPDSGGWLLRYALWSLQRAVPLETGQILPRCWATRRVTSPFVVTEWRLPRVLMALLDWRCAWRQRRDFSVADA